jgi:hypothetical protein
MSGLPLGTGRVVEREHPSEPGPWRWRCGSSDDRWHYTIDDTGWAATREAAERALVEHHKREHTPERAIRWSVERLDEGEWWAFGPGHTFRHSSFPTWREAFDFARHAAAAEGIPMSAADDVREACRHAAREALIERQRSRVRSTLDQHADAAADAVLDALDGAGLLATAPVPEIRGLTVRQPWAAAIVHLGKSPENRSRNVAGSYRGPVLIQSSAPKRDDLDYARKAIASPHFDTTVLRARHPVVPGLPAGASQPFGVPLVMGAVIGVAELVDVHRCGISNPGRPCDPWLGCTPWAEPTGWHLCWRNARPLKTPIPWKGRLGLWRVPPALYEAVRAQEVL